MAPEESTEQLTFESGSGRCFSSENLDVAEGAVTRVVFSNPETGWSVIRLEGPGHNDGPKVVGTLPGVREGEHLKVFGQWVKDSRYGPELRAVRFVVVSPNTERGILKYLGSGMVEGIGTGLAQRLVDAFGAETLDVIQHHPERLQRVDGIGPKRSKQIQQAVVGQQALRQALVFLRGHGLNLGQAQKVYAEYGEETLQKVGEDPYRLVSSIRGVGFLTADRMAQEIGIPADSPQRVEAGLYHELSCATDDGHCFLPISVLVARCVERLGVGRDLIDAALDRLIDRGAVKKEPADKVRLEDRGGGSGGSEPSCDPQLDEGPAEPAIYPMWLYSQEVSTARDLFRLLRSPALPLKSNLDKLLPRLEETMGLAFSALQKKALRTALSEKVVVITGGPGTGKTTLVRAVLAAMESSRLKVSLAAPTGRASRRLKELTGREAQTVHRLLEFAPHLGSFQRSRNNKLDADVVIVDELSMVDIWLASSLLKALGDSCRLILVGDADQLPSVGPGSVLSDILDSGVIPSVRLTEIFRQAQESQIVVGAHQVNSGESLDATGGGGGAGELFRIDKRDPERIVELIRKMIAERIPARYGLDPVRDVQVLCPMKKGEVGTHNLNSILREALNPPTAPGSEESPFRPGDKVMQVRNNYDKEVFNGDIGVVCAFDGESGAVTVEFDRRMVTFERKDRDDLVLAYACTVHKSQGSEYPAVIIPVHTQHFIMLQRNLLYTAITRASRLCVVIGPERAVWRAISNDTIQHRFTGLAARLARGAQRMAGPKPPGPGASRP